MQSNQSRPRQMLLAMTLLAPMTAVVMPSVGVAEPTGANVSQVFATPLPNVPGKNLTAVLVRYAPGAASPSHHHAGSVFAYVLSGVIRSQVSTGGPVKDYKAGENFFEPPGSDHLVSANASTTEPASLLAIFVADDGATLTTMDK
jgi:quercetin dioxygenase-like cupin family protein